MTPTPNANTSFNDNSFYYPLDEDEIVDTTNEGDLLLFRRSIKKELDEFLKNFTNDETIASQLSRTNDFWSKYQLKLPLLFALKIRIECIPASSAYVERFFSICGVVCKDRAMNMKDELIIVKCLLKANFKWLQELNDTK